MNRAAAAEGSKRPVTAWTMLAALPHMLRFFVVRRGGAPCFWIRTRGAVGIAAEVALAADLPPAHRRSPRPSASWCFWQRTWRSCWPTG